ncbi:hypothetical protein [Paenibacillus glycanilyticus]|nr:hypothetical protein [Paenibacillus glycanilyticus]
MISGETECSPLTEDFHRYAVNSKKYSVNSDRKKHSLAKRRIFD